jgi:hypothetical protein
MTEVDLRAVEIWFRRRGLPLVVQKRLRGRALLQRTAPAVVFALLVDPLITLLANVLDASQRELERRVDDPLFVIGVLALAVAILVVPVLVGWLTWRWMRAVGEVGRLVIAWAAVLLNVVGLPLAERAAGLRDTVWLPMAINAGAILVLFGLAYVGAGSILGWGLRHALRQLGAVGTMASRALPLLVLVVLFSFFAAEVWEMANSLERRRLWFVVGFFAVLAVLFLMSVLSDELGEMAQRARDGAFTDVGRLLRNTPLAGAEDGFGVAQPLSRLERMNVALVLFVAQAIQILILAVLTFGMFMVLGTLTMKREVIAGWIGAKDVAGVADGTLFGLQLPVPNALVQVSIFLSVFAGLYFAASAATDPHYRKSFFDPLLDDVQVSLAGRQVYLAHHRRIAYPD